MAKNNSTCDIEPGHPLMNAYGPWDFTNPAHRSQLPIVLGAHFTSNVERLIKGETGKLEHDLDYTLRAIPNYHRALYAVAKYQRINNIKYRTIDEYWTAECYFKRAIYMQPNDAVSRALFAIHLHKLDKLKEAEEQYLKALELDSDNPETHYNLGLLYVETGRLEEAKKHAKVAYEAGYPLKGLKNKIDEAEAKP